MSLTFNIRNENVIVTVMTTKKKRKKKYSVQAEEF